MFGDSITEFGYNGPSGWITLLSQYYSRKVSSHSDHSVVQSVVMFGDSSAGFGYNGPSG